MGRERETSAAVKRQATGTQTEAHSGADRTDQGEENEKEAETEGCEETS